MKRKHPSTEAVIPSELLAEAKRSLETDRPVKRIRCTVCDAECTGGVGPVQDVLCWVCRRLKISAWRESDPAMAAQE
jgi:hypothetical protein